MHDCAKLRNKHTIKLSDIYDCGKLQTLPNQYVNGVMGSASPSASMNFTRDNCFCTGPSFLPEPGDIFFVNLKLVIEGKGKDIKKMKKRGKRNVEMENVAKKLSTTKKTQTFTVSPYLPRSLCVSCQRVGACVFV